MHTLNLQTIKIVPERWRLLKAPDSLSGRVHSVCEDGVLKCREQSVFHEQLNWQSKSVVAAVD